MIYELLFSATGRCEKVLNIISKQWQEEKVRIDLSNADFDGAKYSFTADDLCIVATSVYGGRIPAPIAKRLKQLKGNGAKAVLIAVFGNRAVDDCLFEMRDIMDAQDFVPVAAVEAVAQHTIMLNVQPDRPDAEDSSELTAFAAEIKNRMSEKDSFGALNVPGKASYVDMGTIAFKPKANRNCTNCGLCVKNCPVKAIPADNPRITNKNCINCMRCIEKCPASARSLPKILIKLAYIQMKKEFAGRKPNKLYIAE